MSTFLTLQPSKVIDVIKSSLGDPTNHVTIDINPVVASRPRVTRWGVYYGKKYTAWKQEAENITHTNMDVIAQPCTVLIEQVVRKPKTSKLTFPNGDVDNYAKAPLDVMTKTEFWTDDNLITGLWCSKRFASAEEPARTEAFIYVHQEPYGN